MLGLHVVSYLLHAGTLNTFNYSINSNSNRLEYKKGDFDLESKETIRGFTHKHIRSKNKLTIDLHLCECLWTSP